MLRKSRTFVVIFFFLSVVIFVMFRLVKIASADRTIPVIEMASDSITVSVRGGDEAILEGVKAMDAKDGDITESLFIESRSSFFEKGRFKVSLAVVDKDNHVVKAEREVIYSDYKSPQFSLTGPLKFQTTLESRDDLNIAVNLSAVDVIDGNISNRIKISSDYSIIGNGSVTGDYPMEFVVSNSMGDVAKLPVTVSIYSALEENGLPEITLSKYIINTPAGNSVDLTGLVEQINYHNDTYRRGDDGNFYNGKHDTDGVPEGFSASDITIDENINWDTPGVYEVKISFTDRTANLSNFVRCYIVVH